jgi:hypothetical protein
VPPPPLLNRIQLFSLLRSFQRLHSGLATRLGRGGWARVRPRAPQPAALLARRGPPRFALLLGRYLSSSWSSSIAGVVSRILRWCWRTEGSAPYRETCGLSRKEETTDGRSGERKEQGGAAAAAAQPSWRAGPVQAPPPRPRPRRGEGARGRAAHLEFAQQARPTEAEGPALASTVAQTGPWALGFSLWYFPQVVAKGAGPHLPPSHLLPS